MDQLFEAIPGPVVDLCKRLREKNHRGWVVGGCVRDLLRGAAAKDWDVATDARPEQVQKLFRRVIPTGIQHGTVTVLMGKEGYEVTTLRGEGAYADGRRPNEVVFLDDIEQDLARRDFTFNAIAIDPIDRRLIDPFGGRSDLDARILRAVGEPDRRFQEDGLRILRGARFAASLECEIDPQTLRAMGDERSIATLRQVSQERIHDEWVKSMRAARPSIAFSLMEETAVLDVCCVELRATVGCPQNAETDVWSHTLDVVDRAAPEIRIAALLHDVAKPVDPAHHDELGAEMAATILKRLKFSNEQRQLAVDLIRNHVTGFDPTWTGAELRRWLRRVTSKRVDPLLALAAANAAAGGSESVANVDELTRRARAQRDSGVVWNAGDLALRGKDLIGALDLTPGPIIGRLLAALVEKVTDDPALNEPDALIDIARGIAEDEGSA